MRKTMVWLCSAAFFCLSITCHGADRNNRPPKTTEDTRAEALKQINEFGVRMAKLDPSYASKETRILAAVPIIAKNYSPDQWLERVQFLYAALSEIDAKNAESDPEALVSKYFEDEASRAPPNVLQVPAANREWGMKKRFEELEKLAESGSIDLTELAARMLASALVYFPSDTRFIALRQYRLDLVLKLKRGEIDRQRFDGEWAMKQHEFNDGQERKKVQQYQQQQMMAEQAEAQRRAESSQRLGSVLVGAARGLQEAASIQRARMPVTCIAIGNVMSCQ